MLYIDGYSNLAQTCGPASLVYKYNYRVLDKSFVRDPGSDGTHMPGLDSTFIKDGCNSLPLKSLGKLHNKMNDRPHNDRPHNEGTDANRTRRPDLSSEREKIAESRKYIEQVLSARPRASDLSPEEVKILDKYTDLIYQQQEMELPNLQRARNIVQRAVDISPEMRQVRQEFNMLVLPQDGTMTYYQPRSNTLFVGMVQRDRANVVQAIIAMGQAHNDYITPELRESDKKNLLNAITYKALNNFETKKTTFSGESKESLLKDPTLPEVFANNASENIYQEIYDRNNCSVKPCKIGESRFDAMIKKEGKVQRVHWAVVGDEMTHTRQLIFMQASAKVEKNQSHYMPLILLTHAAMTGGVPVFAVGEADISTSGRKYFLEYVSNASGHYTPSRASLHVGIDMFAKTGIQIKANTIIEFDPLSK